MARKPKPYLRIRLAQDEMVCTVIGTPQSSQLPRGTVVIDRTVTKHEQAEDLAYALIVMFPERSRAYERLSKQALAGGIPWPCKTKSASQPVSVE